MQKFQVKIKVNNKLVTVASKKMDYESSNASVDALDQLRKLLDNNNSYVKNSNINHLKNLKL